MTHVLTRLTSIALVAVTGTATGALALRADRPRSVDRLVPATMPHLPTTPVGTRSVTPAYLPPGATLAGSADPLPEFPEAIENLYQLPGAANANTIPPGGIDETNMYTAHPATRISVFFTPYTKVLPMPLMTDPEYEDNRPVLVAGLPAVLATPKRGFGGGRLDWVDAEGYHVVMCAQLDTVEGVSGVEADELLRIAESLYV
jgi:hypothetical protein